MSYQNHLTRAQVRNFERRARILEQGEPADLYEEHGTLLFVYINRRVDGSAAWYEGIPYLFTDRDVIVYDVAELSPDYVRSLTRADDETAAQFARITHREMIERR